MTPSQNPPLPGIQDRPVSGEEGRNVTRRRLQLLRHLHLRHASILYLLAVIIVIFSLWIPRLFLATITATQVAENNVSVAILALAVLIPLIAGVFDLSVGAMSGFSLVTITWLQMHAVNIILACLIALLACALVGLINAALAVTLKVSSFIATLGTSQILGALALYISKNQTVTNIFHTSFLKFGQGTIHGFPVVVFYVVGLGLIVWYIMQYTLLGRRLYATGANIEAAKLAGINTGRLIYGSFVASAVISGLAGIIYGAQVGIFSNNYSAAYLFPAFAAVFLGATQFNRRPNVWGALLAVYTLALGSTGLQLALSTNVYWISPMFNGVALVIAVAIASRNVHAGSRELVTHDEVGPNRLVAAVANLTASGASHNGVQDVGADTDRVADDRSMGTEDLHG